MSALGGVHLAAAFAAIGIGGWVLAVSPNGSTMHRRLGWAYVASMLTVNVTALAIYQLFGRFGPFHWMALLSLIVLAFGALTARNARAARRRAMPGARAVWVERHYYWMTWSYVGLLAAFASETLTRLPALRPAFGGGPTFALAVASATLVVVGVGALWIRRANAKALARFQSR